MFVLIFWILIIECLTVEIKFVYGNDRVIITIPVHIKKLHHTKTIYKIIERPIVHTGLRINNDQPQTNASPDKPEKSRQLQGRYTGGGAETVVADTDLHETRQHLSHHEDRGGGNAITGYGDRGNGAFDSVPKAYLTHNGYAGLFRYSPYYKHRGPNYDHAVHGARGGGIVIHVVGDHKHGHLGEVMYVGDHKPRHLGDLLQKREPHAHHLPSNELWYEVPGPAPSAAAAAHHYGHKTPAAVRLPVVVPPPPGYRDSPTRAVVHDGGYRVQEDVADDRPPPTTPAPLPYITVSPADLSYPSAGESLDAMSSVAAAVSSPQTAISHVYYTLDPVVPYNDFKRPSK